MFKKKKRGGGERLFKPSKWHVLQIYTFSLQADDKLVKKWGRKKVGWG